MPTDPYARAAAAQTLARARRNRSVRRRARAAQTRTRYTQTPLLAGSPSQQQGQAAERRASTYLTGCGLEILAHNLHCQAGEIDIIARDAQQLVFIEVRQRKNQRHGGAAASVNRHKQRRLIRTAQFLLPVLVQHYFAGCTPACRFDIVCIDGETLDWITDAFRV